MPWTSRSRRIRYSSAWISTSNPAWGANRTWSPASTLRTVGPTWTTSAQTRRLLTSAVAGIRIPARDLRSPSSSDGCTSRRSAAMRIECLVVSPETARIGAGSAIAAGYRRDPGRRDRSPNRYGRDGPAAPSGGSVAGHHPKLPSGSPAGVPVLGPHPAAAFTPPATRRGPSDPTRSAPIAQPLHPVEAGQAQHDERHADEGRHDGCGR